MTDNDETKDDYTPTIPLTEYNEIRIMLYSKYVEEEKKEEKTIYTECSISLEKFNEDDEIAKLPCGHIFTAELIRRYLMVCAKCPNCRKIISRSQAPPQQAIEISSTFGGGRLQLISYGSQDAYLANNPQITFFRVRYSR